MRIAVFSTRPYDRKFFDEANSSRAHELIYYEPRLTSETAALASGFPAVCAFVNDKLDGDVLATLGRNGTRLIALRSAGFNHVDMLAARRLGLIVARVPAYSPYAVAEHTVAIMLALNRKIYRAYARVREGNFELNGLLGFDFHGRTAGIIGTGKIGTVVARILSGFGCRLLGYDTRPSEECRTLGMTYVDLDDLWSQSDIITLHAPLTPETHHIIGANSIARMKRGVMIVNTGRGALVDARAVIVGLKSGHIGHLGLDVYEEEESLFFRDLSSRIITDDVFARLLTFPNVIITAHQAFFTREALTAIAETTLDNVSAFEQERSSGNEIV